MKANYTINEDLNGIEITFESKPEVATIEALKTAGFRWHRVKKLWYAKQNAERIILAQAIAEGTTNAAPATKAAEKIDLANLGENKPHLYGAELAKAIREDLKKRGVKSCTVRSNRSGYTSHITVTIKATADDFASIEEMKERKPFFDFACQVERYGAYTGKKWVYSLEGMTDEEKNAEYNGFIQYNARKNRDINTHYLIDCRNDYYTFTTEFYNKIVAVFKIANQWNYDNSDPMTDYFDVGYYLDIDVKTPDGYEPRENMTEEERAAYNAEIKAEEERKEAEYKRIEAERAERERQYQEAEKKRKAAEKEILQNVTVQDLNKEEALYITNLSGGIGKEASLTELHETINEYPERAKQDAEITRKIFFTSENAFNAFCEMFLNDFDFLAGKGGTATADKRLNDSETFYRMTEEQRESVKFYNCNCIAVYYNNVLQFVINPEGYTYARYTYILTDESEVKTACEEIKAQETESESKPEFYFPDTVEKQADNIQEGDQITVYQCDGWMLNNIYAGSGTLTGFYIGKYAQYDKVLFLELMQNGKTKIIHIRDGKSSLIYKGIKNPLPESITSERINDRMTRLLNADELIPNTYNYYLQQGEKPIIDTCYR